LKGHLKHAVVQPFKQILIFLTLDQFPNYLLFKEIIEKKNNTATTSYFNTNHIFEIFQSGFRKYHSTESALLKVLNYILLTVDSGDHAILVLLDLSAVFNTIDHDILIS